MGYIGNGPYQGVLTGGNIQDGTVETTDLADGAVTTVKINDGAVTAAKLASGAAVPDQSGQSGKYLTTDGSTASWGTVDLSTKVSKTGDTMTGDLTISDASGAWISLQGASSGDIPTGIELRNGATLESSWYVNPTHDTTFLSRNSFNVRTNNANRFSIDSSGRVTMPYQPMFMAYSGAYRSGGNQETLQFTSALSNVGNHYNTSTYTFTAPVSGHYRFSFSLMTYQAGHSRICFAKNGANIANQFYAQTYQSSTEYARNCGEIIVYLAANDTMRVHRNVQNEGSEVVHVDYRHFSGQLVG